MGPQDAQVCRDVRGVCAAIDGVSGVIWREDMTAHFSRGGDGNRKISAVFYRLRPTLRFRGFDAAEWSSLRARRNIGGDAEITPLAFISVVRRCGECRYTDRQTLFAAIVSGETPGGLARHSASPCAHCQPK